MSDRMDAKDILDKYGSKLEGQMNDSGNIVESYSREYTTFREEMAPEFSRYERWCHTLGSFIKLKPSKKDEERVSKYIRIAHLNIESWQALTLGIMAFLFIFFIGIFISVAVTLLKEVGEGGILANFPIPFFILSVCLALAVFYLVNSYPARLANKWRLKASSQMVPAILYVVVYMRHTPNLEKAIAFAAKHLEYPLALDFKKVFYDVEIGHFSSINESLENYLEVWRDYSSEFIEGFHLIQSSLFEPDDARRISILEKALQVVLDGVYDRMLRFTHDVKSPLTNVYMLGVVLPTLGLALLPLASAMLGEVIRWYHVLFLFNIIIPILVFYMTDKVLLLRPGGHGETTLLERNQLYSEYKSKKHYFIAFLVCFPFILLAFLPLIFQYTPIPGYLGLQQDYTFDQIPGFSIFGAEQLFHFTTHDTLGIVGPFGFGALILGMFFPFGIALFFWMSFNGKTKNIIKERDKTKQLEREFNNSLFQLGNRIGNGMPPELVFGRVAESSRGLVTEDFFRRVNYNIRQMGMGVEEAIFDKTRGVIAYYPSDLISTSMRVLVESSKKGLRIAAISLMSISEYVKNMYKITSRLRDMLAEIISDMKSNMTFLAPLLSGIVVGLAAMITAILMKLKLDDLIGGSSAGFGAQLGNLVQLFKYSQMIPPYFLQLIVGVYLIEIIFILTRALVVIDAGDDKLEQTNKTGKNLLGGVLLYFITAMIASLVLFFLSAVVLGNIF